MSYEILDHTADAKFRAVGETREEAFSDAVKAFAEIVGTDPGAGEIRLGGNNKPGRPST